MGKIFNFIADLAGWKYKPEDDEELTTKLYREIAGYELMFGRACIEMEQTGFTPQGHKVLLLALQPEFKHHKNDESAAMWCLEQYATEQGWELSSREHALDPKFEPWFKKQRKDFERNYLRKAEGRWVSGQISSFTYDWLCGRTQHMWTDYMRSIYNY